MAADQIPAISDISRPPRQLVDALAAIGSATLASELYHNMGIRDRRCGAASAVQNFPDKVGQLHNRHGSTPIIEKL